VAAYLSVGSKGRASWACSPCATPLRRGPGHLGSRPVGAGRPHHDGGQPDRLRRTTWCACSVTPRWPRRVHPGALRHGRAFEGRRWATPSSFPHLPAHLRLHEPGAFAAVTAIAGRTGSAELDDWGGLARYAPAWPPAGRVLLSLAGIPPLAGGSPSSSCSGGAGGLGNVWGVVWR